MFRRFPFHPLLFSAYPVLALLSYNIREVEPDAALRPLVLSLAAGISLFIFLRLILRNWHTAALATSIGLLWFFSYGHLYSLLEGVSVLGVTIGRHRYLILAYLVLAVAGSGWILSRPENKHATLLLNLVGILLLAFPLVGITRHFLTSARAQAAFHNRSIGSSSRGQETWTLSPKMTPSIERSDGSPDIYYIILDGYTRGDALLEDLGYDNSPFLDELRRMGFYVADCSRSNYHYTLGSLTSALNLDYLTNLQDDPAARGLGEKGLWTLLKYSLVRSQLENLGYTTVAFESGYEWSRWEDADIYLGSGLQPYTMQRILPFEAMLIKSTVLLPLAESVHQYLVPRFQDINYPYYDHINRQLFILDQLPQIALNPKSTFTFVHILIPHTPYVFGPGGEILTDPGYYGGGKGEPINNEYRRKGYIGEVQFINSRMLPILRRILDQSAQPSVIILQGDHGLRKDNRLKILNAYYLPTEAKRRLYPSISPVNSFRVVFNVFFGTANPGSSVQNGTSQWSLLPDISYKGDETLQVVEETGARCK
jgi:hypothetical protein